MGATIEIIFGSIMTLLMALGGYVFKERGRRITLLETQNIETQTRLAVIETEVKQVNINLVNMTRAIKKSGKPMFDCPYILRGKNQDG